MTSLLSWPPLPMPITTHSRQRAEPLKSPDSKNYRRALATSAIQSYLRMIAVPHRLESSPDGSILYVEELGGYIACCPISANAQKCSIAPQDRHDRKGYLFVELSEPYYSAQILGFVSQVSVGELPLSYLQPLSAFTAALEASANITPIPIADWAEGLIPGWLSPQKPSSQGMRQSLQPRWTTRSLSSRSADNGLYERYAKAQGDVSLARSLCQLSPTAALIQIVERTADDAIRWQAAEKLAYAGISHPLVPVIKVKSLCDDLSGLAVALLVGVITKPNNTFLVGCWLYATGDQQALPENIVLKGIEEGDTEADNRTFCEITPTVHGDPLEYLFTAEGGDRFSLQIYYQDKIATSTFVLPTDKVP